MYIHSVKLVNYKSIGDYDEAEVIIEPTVTAIIGKNESGKSNVLDGLSQIDFMGNKATAYVTRKLGTRICERKILVRLFGDLHLTETRSILCRLK